MGTVVSFALPEARTRATTTDGRTDRRQEARLRIVAARAEAELRRADEVFSTWKPESPISRLRRGEIALEQAPPEVAEVLERCRLAREASEGWFDPWGLPGGVDPTGLVKGWAAQRALQEFQRAGLPGAMINAGGDIAVFGEPEPGQPWRIGIQHPLAADRLMMTVELHGAGAVATSGAYQRGDHVRAPAGRGGPGPYPAAPHCDLVPEDDGAGCPPRGLLSATVMGLDLGFADALATALFASGGRLLPQLGRLRGYHGLVVDEAGVPRTSPGLALTLPVAV